MRSQVVVMPVFRASAAVLIKLAMVTVVSV